MRTYKVVWVSIMNVHALSNTGCINMSPRYTFVYDRLIKIVEGQYSLLSFGWVKAPLP